MAETQKKLERKHFALLAVAKKALKLGDDTWRDVLRSCGGVESAKALDWFGFESVLRRCEELGWVSTARQQFCAIARYEVVTPGQQHKIQALYAELGWDTRRQKGFNLRLLKKGWPQSQAEASKLIECLKKMAARGYSERTKGTDKPAKTTDNASS